MFPGFGNLNIQHMEKKRDRQIKSKREDKADRQSARDTVCLLVVSVSVVISFYCSLSAMANWGLYQCRGRTLWVFSFTGACFKGLLWIIVISLRLFRGKETPLCCWSPSEPVDTESLDALTHSNQDPDIHHDHYLRYVHAVSISMSVRPMLDFSYR